MRYKILMLIVVDILSLGGADTVPLSFFTLMISDGLTFFRVQTVSSVQSFFLAMALYPEVQKRAQAELDRVVGPKGLPEFSDRDDLPYINALVKETMRWHLVTPLGRSFLFTLFNLLIHA